MCAAALLSPLARLEPGQARERGALLAWLSGVLRQLGRLVVAARGPRASGRSWPRRAPADRAAAESAPAAPRSRAEASARRNDSRAVRDSRRKSGASSAQRQPSGGPESSSSYPAIAIASRIVRGPSSPAPQNTSAIPSARRAVQASMPSSSRRERRARGAGVIEHRLHAPGRERGVGRLGPQQGGAASVVRCPLRGVREDRAGIHGIAARERHVPAEVRDLDPDAVVARERSSLVEQAHGALSAPRHPGVRGRLEQPSPARLVIRAEARGALCRQRGRGVGTALVRPCGRQRERIRGRAVGPEGGLAEVPGAFVGEARIGQRRCERSVGGAALRWVGSVVHGRAHERVAELDVAVGDDHEPGGLGLLERSDLDAERLGRLARARRARRARRLRRRAARAVSRSERRETRPAKARSTVVAIGSGPSTRLAATLSASPASSISASGLPPVARNSRSAPPSGRGSSPLARQQCRGGAEIEPAERERRDARIGERRALARTHAGDDRDRVGEQPARSEQNGFDGGSVEPVRIVQEHAQRALLGGRGEHAESRRADHQPLAADARPERERGAQRGGLRRGQVLDVLEHGTQQLQQAAERDRGLALDAARRRARASRRPRPWHGVGEQRALADARFSAHDERSARADARVGEEALDRCTLRLATEQHAPSMTQGRASLI